MGHRGPDDRNRPGAKEGVTSRKLGRSQASGTRNGSERSPGALLPRRVGASHQQLAHTRSLLQEGDDASTSRPSCYPDASVIGSLKASDGWPPMGGEGLFWQRRNLRQISVGSSGSGDRCPLGSGVAPR